MIATRIRQKDATFYFVAFPAEDLLQRVRFITRFYGEGGSIAPAPVEAHDEVAQFIAQIERSERAFQRQLARAKVKAVKNFYEKAVNQPPIPGEGLAVTTGRLQFQPLGELADVGDLQQPLEKYLIIDGQHRLAALHFYAQAHPEEARTIHVPCVIFDGQSEDFAAEMFVIINSTPTRINKSHLVDLYERVSWATPDRRLAAMVVDRLYRESDSPLRYRINRLGGRSHKDKWILQAELFNEVHRWLRQRSDHATAAEADRYYRVLRDFFKAAQAVWGEAWGNDGFMVTRPVTLKAMVRVCADLVAAGEDQPEEDRLARWVERLQPWAEVKREFRVDGFYQRFPAKGQVERVSLLHRELARYVGLRNRSGRNNGGRSV